MGSATERSRGGRRVSPIDKQALNRSLTGPSESAEAFVRTFAIVPKPACLAYLGDAWLLFSDRSWGIIDSSWCWLQTD